MSIAESVSNQLVGLALGFCITLILISLFGHFNPFTFAAISSGTYVVVGLIRSYVIRRVFNNVGRQ